MPRKTTASKKDASKYRLAETEQRIADAIRNKDVQLKLSSLRLTELPENLQELKWLQRLDLQGNYLVTLPDWISEFSELNSLIIYNNPLRKLPVSLGRLEQLDELIIGGGIQSVASKAIGNLTNLRILAIADLGLKRVPHWIQKLKKIESLYLFGNLLTEVPEWLGNLSKLRSLDLRNNQLNALPISLYQSKSLERLYVGGNPDLRLPVEISKSENARKILDYYFRTVTPGASLPLNEFKLVLVGRGGVGKTSLVHRLVSNKYKEFKRTPGINITKWPATIDDEEVRAHIWDFGGQEIMHGTHRFFMTERALYLVLISGREGTEDRDAEYWLSLIRSFAGNVPIIVLRHKWDDFSFELNKGILREKYGKNLVFLETDSLTGQGIPELRDKICQMANTLPGLKAAWPSEWRRIKDALPARRKSWLTFEDFRRFCQQNGVKDSRSQELLAESLHDLGLMLSFQKDETLRNFGVLNPQWVTKGIYEMLNSRILKDAGGRFTLKSFSKELPATKYPEVLHPYLLGLMRKFNLCHPLDDKGEHYLIPELLTKNEPQKLDTEFLPKQCLNFIYCYNVVIPEGLLPRFIVETYVHRKPKQVWRTGVVLERANCRALVRGDVQGRIVTIRVAGVGNGRRELLGIIREHFERIHKSYEKLPVTELVPIPEYPDAHVEHELLLKYENDQRKTITVDMGNKLMDWPVKELLDGVDLPGLDRSKTSESKRPFEQSRLGRRNALSIFISYSHKDELYRDELRGALTAYERIGDLISWDDTCIVPGQEWEPAILDNLERASIIILLLSTDFIRSDYCVQIEMKRALERDAIGECAIVPIVVRACTFTKLEVGKIQAILPKDKPVKQHRDRDAAWLEVTKQLDRVIANLKKQ